MAHASAAMRVHLCWLPCLHTQGSCAHVCWHAHSWARPVGDVVVVGVLAVNGVYFLSWWLIERSAKDTTDHPSDVMVCLQSEVCKRQF